MGSLAGTYNITADQGATFTRTLTWRDANDALVNLTGYTARMQVRPTIASNSVALELTTENGRITLGGALGTIALNVPATAMDDLVAGSYSYDLELVNGATVVRLVMGSFVVRAEVTR